MAPKKFVAAHTKYYNDDQTREGEQKTAANQFEVLPCIVAFEMDARGKLNWIWKNKERKHTNTQTRKYIPKE